MALLEEHGSDGVRYWAARGAPGSDTAFDAGQMKVGRRLSIKLLNAAKFVLARSEPRGAVTHVLDRGLLTNLLGLVRNATEKFEQYDYAWVLQHSEAFFWDFCDNYLELAKARKYGDRSEADAASANAAMLVALSVLTRLLAPFLPFVTEETWSWWHDDSVHMSAWPTPEELEKVLGAPSEEDSRVYQRTSEILGDIRKRKTERQLSPGAPLQHVAISSPDALETMLGAAGADLQAASRAQALLFKTSASYDIDLTPLERPE
jgi:valyl-tRNA synthetase